MQLESDVLSDTVSASDTVIVLLLRHFQNKWIEKESMLLHHFSYDLIPKKATQ